MADQKEIPNMVDQAFYKFMRMWPSDFAEDYVEWFCEKIMNTGDGTTLDKKTRGLWKNALIENMFHLRDALVEDIRDSVPNELVDCVYVDDPKKAVPVSSELAEAAENGIREQWKELREVNLEVQVLRAAKAAYEKVLKSAKTLAEDERLLVPTERDVAARATSLAESGYMSDGSDEEDASAAAGRPRRPPVEHSRIMPGAGAKVGAEEDEDEEGEDAVFSEKAGGGTNATRVICSGMAASGLDDEPSGSGSARRVGRPPKIKKPKK